MAEQITWTTADGNTTIDLTDQSAGYTVLADGTRGLRSLAYELATTKYAGIDGEHVDYVTAVANEPTIGLSIQAGDEDSFRAQSRSLVRAMRPKAGPGALTVRNETGEARTLICRCVGGFEGDSATDVTLPGAWWKLALKFHAEDPWWYGDPQNISVGLGAPTTFFPIFPLTLSSSSVQGTFTVDLSGSDDGAYPVWTVIGPGSGLTLSNQTTGQSITVNASLAAGELMTIDTRPGNQSIRRGDGTNLLGALSSDPALWKLIEDVNQVSAVLIGATSSSRITGNFQPRFAGA